jgi:hypothetical protein
VQSSDEFQFQHKRGDRNICSFLAKVRFQVCNTLGGASILEKAFAGCTPPLRPKQELGRVIESLAVS